MQLVRHRLNRLDVLSYVVADETVSARGRVFKFPFFVHDRDSHPIDFRLDHNWNFFVRQKPRNPLVEIRDFLLRVSIVEAEHRHPMLDLRKSLKGFAADALAR